MEKYFAMYLPIKGEIKGGKFKTPMGTIATVHKILESFPEKILDTNGNCWPAAKCEKVELSLCSRDLRVGDKVYNADRPSIGIGEVINPYGDGELLNIKFESFQVGGFLGNSYFKIIGPVSEDAGWVKEGDKFGDKDIDLGENLYPGTITRAAIKLLGLIPPPIKIKGICGHFH